MRIQQRSVKRTVAMLKPWLLVAAMVLPGPAGCGGRALGLDDGGGDGVEPVQDKRVKDKAPPKDMRPDKKKPGSMHRILRWGYGKAMN